jgi:hypothetical protein
VLREWGGRSDACDAESLVCYHERRGREMLGLQSLWPGDGSFWFVFTCRFERLPVLGEYLLVADGVDSLCSSEITQEPLILSVEILPFLLSD